MKIGGRGLKRSTGVLWRPGIEHYRAEECRGVTFATEKDLVMVLELFWGDGPLARIPREIIGGRTVILPADAIPYLERERIRFEAAGVISAGDLPPEEMREVRRQRQFLRDDG